MINLYFRDFNTLKTASWLLVLFPLTALADFSCDLEKIYEEKGALPPIRITGEWHRDPDAERDKDYARLATDSGSILWAREGIDYDETGKPVVENRPIFGLENNFARALTDLLSLVRSFKSCRILERAHQETVKAAQEYAAWLRELNADQCLWDLDLKAQARDETANEYSIKAADQVAKATKVIKKVITTVFMVSPTLQNQWKNLRKIVPPMGSLARGNKASKSFNLVAYAPFFASYYNFDLPGSYGDLESGDLDSYEEIFSVFLLFLAHQLKNDAIDETFPKEALGYFHYLVDPGTQPVRDYNELENIRDWVTIDWRDFYFSRAVVGTYCQAAKAGKPLHVLVGTAHVPGLVKRLTSVINSRFPIPIETRNAMESIKNLDALLNGDQSLLESVLQDYRDFPKVLELIAAKDFKK